MGEKHEAHLIHACTFVWLVAVVIEAPLQVLERGDQPINNCFAIRQILHDQQRADFLVLQVLRGAINGVLDGVGTAFLTQVYRVELKVPMDTILPSQKPKPSKCFETLAPT